MNRFRSNPNELLVLNFVGGWPKKGIALFLFGQKVGLEDSILNGDQISRIPDFG